MSSSNFYEFDSNELDDFLHQDYDYDELLNEVINLRKELEEKKKIIEERDNTIRELNITIKDLNHKFNQQEYQYNKEFQNLKTSEEKKYNDLIKANISVTTRLKDKIQMLTNQLQTAQEMKQEIKQEPKQEIKQEPKQEPKTENLNKDYNMNKNKIIETIAIKNGKNYRLKIINFNKISNNHKKFLEDLNIKKNPKTNKYDLTPNQLEELVEKILKYQHL